MSCDHHDRGGCVPDNRSRARMLQQFAAAAHFGDAFLAMVRDSDLNLALLANGAPLPTPTVTIRIDRFLAAWVAYVGWCANQPRGDDLAPPVDPPSVITIPNLPD